MDIQQARRRIRNTFESSFDKVKFIDFIKDLLNQYDESKAFHLRGCYIPKAFENIIKSYERIGTYTDSEGKKIDLLIVYLKKETTIDRARTAQRNFIANYLKGRGEKDAGLVAFVSPEEDDWRFSFVKMEYKFEKTPEGDVKVKEEFTAARRYSFLVGKNESSHTAQSRLVNILTNDEHNPTLTELEEAFNIESVTKEFFLKYRDLFIRTKEALDKEVQNNPNIKNDFEAKGVNTVDFAKKLLGQIVFLYFLQKKGWFGVGRDDAWGTGSKQFLREIFAKKHGGYNNFFNDILEPLFYEALRIGEERKQDDYYYSRFNCKIPFLNGGLFDPIGNYDWVHTDMLLPDSLFSNFTKTKEGDTGDGILDIFDRYNFTVREDEPLEKEVAIDPELLGKAYEKFNAIRPDNFEEYREALKSSKKGNESKFNKQYGVYYTPREIVHYMCQQSLINYLFTELNSDRISYEKLGDHNLEIFGNKGKKGQLDITIEHREKPLVSKEDIEKFIYRGEQISENEAIALIKEQKINTGIQKSTEKKLQLSESIRKSAELIDQKLLDITICDPAVGSGAFPVGMMSEIVKARMFFVKTGYLEEEYTNAHDEKVKRTSYNFKRDCIEKSLYGVDIDPGAVEIAKLRLWLSLVVDEEDIKNIKPLPNLDYKIVCGNSLLGYPYTPRGLEKIEKLKEQFFTETNPTRKNELRSQIEDAIYSLCKNTEKSLGYKVTMDFKIYFSEVFHKKGGSARCSDSGGGFDVVIANPPYIGQKGNKELFEVMKSDINFEKKMDYWHFFLHKAYYINNINGITALITPNYWVTARGARKLRKRIVDDYEFIEWINFNDNNIFEAGVHTNVFILKKSLKKNPFVKCTIFTHKYENNFIQNMDKELCFTVNQNLIYKEWSNFVHFLPQEVLNIIEKLINNSEKLCDVETIGEKREGMTAGKHLTDGICNLNQGLVTGKDRFIDKNSNINEGVFVVNIEEAKKFTNTDQKKLKEFFKNSDINQYFVSNYPKYYLIYVNDVDSELELKKYPSIYSHLLKFKNILLKRSINGVLQSAYQKGKWWALTTDRPNIDFDGEKILCPQRNKINTFGYSDNTWYAASDVFYISLNKKEFSLKYLLSILNSKLIYYWLFYMGKRKGEILELTLEPLQFIPIKKISFLEQKPFIDLVNKILTTTKEEDYLCDSTKQTKIKEYKHQIDEMVYQLYDLTQEEIEVVEGLVKDNMK